MRFLCILALIGSVLLHTVSSAFLLRDVIGKSILRSKSKPTNTSQRDDVGRAIKALVDSNLLIKDLKQCSECSYAETEDALLTCVTAQCPASLTQLIVNRASSDEPSSTLLSRSSLDSSSTSSSRTKRWQYSDHLQLCIKANCQGKTGDVFFACIYDHCFSTN